MKDNFKTSVLLATVDWLHNNEDKVDYFSPMLMTFLFENIQNLNFALNKVEFPWAEKFKTGSINNGKYGTHINFDIPTEKYISFRAVIGFINDIYNLTTTIRKFKNLTSVNEPLKELFKEVNKFKDLRHFYIHLDEHLYNWEKHGIDGPASTNCGIEYKENAVGYFHLVFIENTLCFSRQKKCLEIDLSKEAFGGIIENTKIIYKEMIKDNDRYDFINIDKTLI